MSVTTEHVCLAVDLGAESGRIVAGRYNGVSIHLSEVHRFTNAPVDIGGALHWNFSELWDNIVQGLKLAAECYGRQIVSIGVDTWAVDYGLIDAQGNLLGEPRHYRDSRTDGMQEEAFKRVPRREIYERTGIQFLPFNTIYQLIAEAKANTHAYRDAAHLLMIPDLINFKLTGQITHELTNASTSQLLDVRTLKWSTDLLTRLGLRTDLFSDPVHPGRSIGTITPEIVKLTGLDQDVHVVTVGSHDTASAVAGTPARREGWAYLSSGTWSLLGVELDEPVINDISYEHGFTNEVGVLGKVRLLKNISGLWLLQECRRQWEREGRSYDYAELAEMATQTPSNGRLIDTNTPSFAHPGDMPSRINEYLIQTGQRACENAGQMARTILESLAQNYKQNLTMLEALIGYDINTLHIVGGGAKNKLLNQLTANATKRRIIAGPVEATAAGNILIQMIAGGYLEHLHKGRTIISRSLEIYSYPEAGRHIGDFHT